MDNYKGTTFLIKYTVKVNVFVCFLLALFISGFKANMLQVQSGACCQCTPKHYSGT